ERRFGANTSAIGQSLPVPGGPSPIVVGVLPAGFELLFPPEANIEQFPDIWFAARIPYDTANRNNVQSRVIGRMKQVVTPARPPDRARRELVAARSPDAGRGSADFRVRHGARSRPGAIRYRRVALDRTRKCSAAQLHPYRSRRTGVLDARRARRRGPVRNR